LHQQKSSRLEVRYTVPRRSPDRQVAISLRDKVPRVPGASHTVSREADVGVERLFDVVVAEDVLPHVLHRWGPIPAVAGTRDLTGPWDTPGSTRTVLLADGGSARERVLGWERGRRFEYRVDRFTSALGRLIDHAIGTWEFAETPRGSSFRWTYRFEARGRAAALLLRPFVSLAWSRYMGQCADLTVELAASGWSPGRATAGAAPG
jgi:hypothetical protein